MVGQYPVLRGLDTGGRGARPGQGPVLLERHDREFVDAVLDELSAGDGLARLAKSVMPTGPGKPSLRLYQPVHRVFHLAMLELCCSQFGEPRIDPQRIESAGLVMRRVADRREEIAPRQDLVGMKVRDLVKVLAEIRAEAAPPDGHEMAALPDAWIMEPAAPDAVQGERVEGWMQLGSKLRGWVRFSSLEDQEQDPDPKRRRSPVRTGHPYINARLTRPDAEPLSEAVAPLFVAPPEAAAATGKTILYGLVPVVSTEQSEVAAPVSLPEDADLAIYLAPYLVADSRRGSQPAAIPYPTGTLRAAEVQDANQQNQTIRAFTGLLRQVSTELDAFGDSPAARKVRAALARLQVPFQEWRMVTEVSGPAFPGSYIHESRRIEPIVVFHPADEFLKEASALLTSTDLGLGVKMPLGWAEVSEGQAADLLAATQAAVRARLEALAAREGRFDLPAGEYRLRAFARVRREGGCPPVLVWSEYSPRFSIRPWHEPSPAPPVQVPLPEIDPSFLKALKPNVAFLMPPKLAALLRDTTPDTLLGGQARSMEGGLAWICGFNIPIITICAIIALYIILNILNIVFHWLPWVKICIPYPRR